MKAFVTGATGFIGGALAARLRAEGWVVTALVRDPARAALLKDGGVELAPGDVEKSETLAAPMRGADAVFHCAARVDVIKPRLQDLLRTNVEGTRNVLEAAKKARVPRTVFLSSVAALGRKHEQADETVWHDGDYASRYEESKHKAEQVALALGQRGLPVVHVLPSVVIGPGDPKTGSFLQRYLRRRVPAVPREDGTVSYVHVEDLVDGILLAYRKGRPNERYIFSQATWTTTQLLSELELASGVPPPRRLPKRLLLAAAVLEEARAFLLRRPPMVSRNAIELATRRFGYTSAKARRELGWSPADFRQRFQTTVRYWQREVEAHG